MQRIKMYAACLASVLCLSGCVTNMGPGGAAPGLFHSGVTYPNMLNPGMQYRIVFDRDDIELLGQVEAEALSKWLFFIASWGDSGYARLLKKSQALGGDGVMNVTIDTEYRSWFIFFATVKTKLSGQAYRYRTRAPGKLRGAP